MQKPTIQARLAAANAHFAASREHAAKAAMLIALAKARAA